MMATNLITDEQFYVAASRHDKTVYVSLFVKSDSVGRVTYLLDVIEPAVLDTQCVTLTVDSLQKALDQAGKVAFRAFVLATICCATTSARANAPSINPALTAEVSEPANQRLSLQYACLTNESSTGG